MDILFILYGCDELVISFGDNFAILLTSYCFLKFHSGAVYTRGDEPCYDAPSKSSRRGGKPHTVHMASSRSHYEGWVGKSSIKIEARIHFFIFFFSIAQHRYTVSLRDVHILPRSCRWSRGTETKLYDVSWKWSLYTRFSQEFHFSPAETARSACTHPV